MSASSHTNDYFSGHSRGDPLAPNPLILLAQRCRIKTATGAFWSFDGIDHVHVWIDPQNAFVFVIKNGAALTIEEPAGIFPSDELVAKFKLMMGL